MIDVKRVLDALVGGAGQGGAGRPQGLQDRTVAWPASP